MVRYLDPQEEDTSRVTKRRSNGEKAAALKAKNASLDGEQAVDAAREAALRLLERRAYASGKLAAKLAEKGFRAEAIETVIERFSEVGLLDDAAYAQALVRTRFEERALVGVALRQELKRQGIKDELISAAMDQIDAQLMEQKGRDLARRKWQASPPEKAYQRTASLLARKGYSPGQINRIISELRSE